MRGLGRLLAIAVVIAAVATCGTGSSPGASPTERRASNFDEFAAEHCAAAQAVFRGYGNPDTAGLSVLMLDFESAVERGDVAAATLKAGELTALFEDGRSHAHAAAGWDPAATAMGHLDGMLRGFVRMVEAELAGIGQGASAAKQAGQVAFQAESGPEDWYGWLRGVSAAMAAAGVGSLPACEDVPL